MDIDSIAADIDPEYASVPPNDDQEPTSPTVGKTAKTHLTVGPQAQSSGEAQRKLNDKKAAVAAADAKAKEEVRRTVGRADEGQQVDRLATGVTIDTGSLLKVNDHNSWRVPLDDDRHSPI